MENENECFFQRPKYQNLNKTGKEIHEENLQVEKYNDTLSFSLIYQVMDEKAIKNHKFQLKDK